jgi:hypothetical protein
MNRIASLVLTFVALTAPLAASAEVPISPALRRYFTPKEIAQYQAATANLNHVKVDPNGDPPVNRLTDPAHNRCGNDVLPVGECPRFQQLAWNDGAGCINEVEYNFALSNAIAPICNPFDATAFLGWCRCGCFEKTTTLRALSLASGDEAQAVVSEIETSTHEVFAMTEDSTLSDLAFEPRTLTATTAGDEEKPLVWVHLANGVRLGLTTEHAVLLSSGEMIRAESLTTEHQLVEEDGTLVAVTEIVRTPTADQVYNVLTDAGLKHKGHMVVANGIVVGDIMWQNTLAADLGDIVVRM